MFVTFEGIGGAGKTTQTRLLGEFLRAEGFDAVTTREPGGTPLGEKLRELLLEGDDLDALSEAFLFATARAELVASVIAPALRRGWHVVSDRFLDSSLAYQGIVRGVGLELVLRINELATNATLPSRTFLIVVDPRQAEGRRKATNRIEGSDIQFKEALNSAYQELAAQFADRFVALDGSRPVEEIAEEVRANVRNLL